MKRWSLLFLLISMSAGAGKKADKATHTKDCYLEPCEIKADFDGDGKEDTAMLVKNKSGQRGIQFQLAGKKTFVVGAGKRFGNGGADFSWMDTWKLHEGPIEAGADEKKPPTPKGASVLVEKSESASGIIYWDGKRFLWYQQGD